MSARPPLEPTLRALVTQARQDLDDHPTPESLVAYHGGTLPADQEETLRDHLALCPDCAELLLDLVSYAEFTPADETAVLADGEVESAWQKVQPQLSEEEEPIQATPAPKLKRFQERRREDDRAYLVPRRRLVPVYAIAATFFFAAVGLSIWGLSLRKEVAEATNPKTDIVIATLFPDGEGPRGGPDTKPILPRSSIVVLDLLGVQRSEEYSASLIDRSGRTVWSSPPLHRVMDGGSLTFEIPRNLAAGDYRIRLFTLGKGGRESVAAFRLQVSGPGSR